MKDFSPEVYRIALTLVPGIGSVRARSLIEEIGSAEGVFKSKESRLGKIPGITKDIAGRIQDKSILERATKELEFISRNDIQLLFYMDAEYPERLKVYNDAPICLYYKGNLNLNKNKHVSIIGTRKPSERGRWACEKIVSSFKTYDIATISGLAYGVDITAHVASLDSGVPTVGVVAHGLDTIYPSAHRSIAKRMIANGGILSEFPSGTKAEKDRFPARNRIIAMLADALLVVESKERGGSMITANFANDYSKDVFAIPGRIDDEKSKGCNKLIKEHKAFLLESGDELIKMMRWEKKTEKEIQRSLFYDLSSEEKKIVETIKIGLDTIDEIHKSTGLLLSELASLILNLEIKGVIRSLPGKKYMVLM